MHGRARIARLMLESEYRSDIINAKSNDGWTPLHVAAHYGRDSFVRLLLEFKAEVDPLSDKGTTPLQLAIIRERSSCVKILLDHNANIDIQNGFLLRYAVIKSNHSYCRMFLQRGADTNLGRLEDGQTPLHLSALRDDVLCARMLYNYGADTNTRNYEGQTPLAVSISISGSSRPCLDFLQEVTRQPRNLQDLCRIKIRQCIGLQNLKLLDELPIAKNNPCSLVWRTGLFCFVIRHRSCWDSISARELSVVAVAGVHAHLQQEGVRHALPWQVHTLRDRTCSLMITVDHMKLRF
ncbi:ankyrin repeat and SOCS box protein 7 isoform X3 [Castor canadensis]